MSETDDTDDLLLIPPNLFMSDIELAETYCTAPYFYIVDNLITQVHKLEHKVNFIARSDSSNLVTSFDFCSDMEERRGYGSTDDILRTQDGYLNKSSYSTPQKPRVKYRRDTQTPPASPQRHHRQMLDDIEKFINNSENPTRKNKKVNDDMIEVNGRLINLKEVECMLSEIETQKNHVQFSDREVFRDTDRFINRKWRDSRDNQDGGAGVKFLYAAQLNSLDNSNNTDSALGDKSASASSSDSTQTTAMRNPTKLTVSDVKHLKGDSLKNAKLLSLSELWSRNGRETITSVKEKLHEEKLRRQHCEQLIQELQLKTLELEERVAVAVKVDEAKDKALTKFHDAWEQMTGQYNKITEERDSLELEIKQQKDKSLAELQESSKKVEQYENEVSKALSLAHAGQEKLSQLEDENTNLNSRLACLECKLNTIEEKYCAEVEKNKRLNDIVVQKELEINENKNVLTESRTEVCQCKKAIELCQGEFTNMKNQYEQLELLLNTKQEHIKELEIQKRNILNDNDNLKSIQRSLQNEIARLKDSSEKNKIELRNFYQEQVEIVVRDKLKEFQRQLDRTETTLQNEIKVRELNVAKTAAGHIHQLTEKHSLEVNLLEEKHKEEVKLYQVQLTQSQQQVDYMQQKLKQVTDRRTCIMQQLHKVMEAQWVEAIKIINNGKSPINPHDGTLDQLYTLKTKSYSNLEEVLSDKMEEVEDRRTNYPTRCGGSSSSVNDEYVQCYKLEETPLTSKVNKGRQQIENDLQKYVHMLLSKQSHNTDNMDNGGCSRSENSSEERLNINQDDPRNKMNTQNRRGMKPPWK